MGACKELAMIEDEARDDDAYDQYVQDKIDRLEAHIERLKRNSKERGARLDQAEEKLRTLQAQTLQIAS
jgi:chaperonin cofactor prefoldin